MKYNNESNKREQDGLHSNTDFSKCLEVNRLSKHCPGKVQMT